MVSVGESHTFFGSLLFLGSILLSIVFSFPLGLYIAHDQGVLNASPGARLITCGPPSMLNLTFATTKTKQLVRRLLTHLY